MRSFLNFVTHPLPPPNPRLPPTSVGAFSNGSSNAPTPTGGSGGSSWALTPAATRPLKSCTRLEGAGVPRREQRWGFPGGEQGVWGVTSIAPPGADEAMRGRRSGRKNQVQPRQRHADFFGSPQAGVRGGNPQRLSRSDSFLCRCATVFPDPCDFSVKLP